MKSLRLIAGFAICCCVHAEVAPRVDVISITPAPKHQSDLSKVVLKIVNATDKTFYYIAWGREGVAVGTDTWMGRFWAPDILVQSGIGFEEYELRPGESIVVTVTPNPQQPAGWTASKGRRIVFPLRFRFTCYKAPKMKDYINCYSRECAPQEFWGK